MVILLFLIKSFEPYKLPQLKIALTLPIPISDEEKKSNQIFIFILLCGTSKGLIETLKAFIKPFEATQRSVKTKI